MTQVTNRLSNQNIAAIAKQQYETSKRSKLPTVVVPLASKGLIYPEAHPLRSGKLEMRYLTAYDEDILTNASYAREGIIFDKLLEAIIQADINVAEIAPCDKDGLILQARILAYGPEYPVNVTDPKTKKTLERVIDLRLLKNKPFALVPDENGEFIYNINSTSSIKFTYSTETDSDSTSSYLTRIIRQVNETRIPAEIEDFIRYEFLAIDAKPFRKYVIDNKPGVDMTFTFEGEDGSTFDAGFSVGADLFWF
jgi:hypothetical protein